MFKRMMCYLLCLVMLAGLSPVNLLAQEQEAPPVTQEVPAPAVEAQEEEPPVVDSPPAAIPAPAPAPQAEAPKPEEPKPEAPKPPEPVVEAPVVEAPVVDEPVVDDPVVDEPVVDEPVVDEPVVDEPVVDEPVVDEPVVDEPVVDEPVVDEPVVDEPVVDEPVADEPVVEEPLEETLPQEEQIYFTPQRAVFDHSAPDADISLVLLDSAPALLGIEGLTQDADYQLSGLKLTFLPGFLTALPLGELTLRLQFEGDVAQPFYLSVVNSQVLPEEVLLAEELQEAAAPAEEVEPLTLMAMSDNPIIFENQSYEITQYLQVPHEGEVYLDSVFLQGDVSYYGTPVWTLTGVSGGAVSNLFLQGYSNNAGIFCDSLVTAGTTTATITCTVGEYSASVPITITVVGGTVPESMETPASYQGQVNTPLTISRPTLLPAGTDLSSDLFSFGFYINSGTVEDSWVHNGNDSGGYDVVFSQPGFYYGYVSMHYQSISFNQRAMFIIKDDQGNIPGSPVVFNNPTITKNFYLGSSTDISTWISLNRNSLELGQASWTVGEVMGMPLNNLRIGTIDQYGASLVSDAPTVAGTTTVEVICTIGEYSNSAIVTINAIEAVLPETINLQSSYDAQVGVPFALSRPTLLPATHTLDEQLFYFDVHRHDAPVEINGSSQEGYQLLFSEPGYYQMRVYMGYESIGIYQAINFKVLDENGNPPANPIQFTQESYTIKAYKGGRGFDFYAPYVRDIAALGTPTSTLSNIQGSAVSGLQVHNSYTYQVQMYFQEALEAGITTATLTTEVGDFTASTQIRIEVLDVPVPTDLTGVPALVNGSINTPILVARPSLFPADTGLPENEFEFYLHAYPGEVTIQGNDKQVVFREAGYYQATLMMNYNNIYLQKTITFAIADESGVVPGELIELSQDRLENQVYLSGSTSLSASSVQVYGDLSAFGTGSWSLTDIAGDAISGLKIGYQSDDYCALQIDSIHSVGQTTATLTFTVGEFSKSIPVVITVIDAPVPTELTNVPSLVNGHVNTPILITRPGVSPADTGITAEDFNFHFYCYGGEVNQQGDVYEAVFTEPGYYYGSLIMAYSNVVFEEKIIFAIADEDGQVPGDLIDFGMDSYQRTHYLKGNNYSTDFYIYQRNNLSAFGVGTWTLSGLSGDAIGGLRLGWQSPYNAGLYYDRPFKAGVSTATLTYTVGEYSKSLPITIIISDETVPTKIDMPTVYQANVGDTLHVPRPGLLPKGTNFDVKDFFFYIEVDGDVVRTETDDGFNITFNQAGYLTGGVQMSYANVTIFQRLVFEVKDASGTVPGKPLEFMTDTIEATFYFKEEQERQSFYVDAPLGALAYDNPVYTLTNIKGTSFSNIIIRVSSNGHMVTISGMVAGVGDTTATLNCTAGPHSISIPVIVHVPDVVLPTGFVFPAVITGKVNQELFFAQPKLLPDTTPLSEDDFYFEIGIHNQYGGGDFPGHQGADGFGYYLTFSEPGYYRATAFMNGQGFYFERNVVFQIQDESGTVPGSPYMFNHTALDLTFYLDDKSWTIPEIQLDKFLPDQGQAVWSYRKLDAAAPSLRANLWLSDDRQTEYYDLNLSDVTTEGTFRYEVVCVLAGQTHIIPVNITFTSKTPPSLSLENTVFTIKAQEWFTLPRPVFNPGDSGIDGSTLEMNIWGDSEFWDVSDVDANQHVKIFEPGYYSATIQMVNDEYDGRIDISFIVTSPDGTPPDGAPLKFEEANANFTINKQGGETVRGFYNLSNSFPGLGKPVFTIETLSGDAVTAVVDTKASGYWYGVVHYTALKDSGQTVFRLKVSAGGYEDSMQITVTVDNRTVPTEMVIPAAQYEVTVGQPLTLGRPQLLPQNTQVSTDLFRYDIYVRESEATTTEDTQQQKSLIFNQPGYYTVMVYMGYNNISFNKELLVTVKEEGGQTPPVVMITSMEFDKAEDILPFGETRLYDPVIQPVNPSNPILSFTSSDETVLKNATGEYWKAIKPGTATLTAMATDGSGVTATCTITVPSVTYDMSQVAWTTTTAFNFDGTEKTVELTGLPAGVTATYTGNTATEMGAYIASVVLTYDNPAFIGPTFEDLSWEITGPDVPTRAKPKITKVEAVNATALKLTWSRVAGASGYNVYVSARPNDSYTLLKSTTALSLSITRLKAGTRYFYKVEAYDLIGGIQYVSSPMSSWAAGVPLARPAITSITSPSARRITLTWNKSAGAGGWQVMFATSAKGPWKVVRTIFVTNASFAGLKSGSTFYFKIRPYKKYYAYAYFGPESPVRYVKVK